jgi:hypothetical protein
MVTEALRTWLYEKDKSIRGHKYGSRLSYDAYVRTPYSEVLDKLRELEENA